MNLDWHIACKGFSLGLALLCLFSCRKEDKCFTPVGEITSEHRDLKGFNAIDISNRVDVVLIQDSTEYIEVEFGEKLFGSVGSMVEDSILHLTENVPCKALGKQRPFPLVKVHFTHLRNLFFHSAGHLSSAHVLRLDTLNLDVIDVSGIIEISGDFQKLAVINHTAATDFTLHGTSNEIEVYHSGFGTIDASELASRIAVVNNNSTGKLRLNVEEHLYYQLHDLGDIYLIGDPQISVWNHSGAGTLIID